MAQPPKRTGARIEPAGGDEFSAVEAALQRRAAAAAAAEARHASPLPDVGEASAVADTPLETDAGAGGATGPEAEEGLTGTFEQFHEDTGQLAQRASMLKGVLHGPVEMYAADGTPTVAAAYILGKLVGEVRIFHENGSVQQIAHYRDDVLHGPVLTYDEAGRLVMRGGYHDGKVHGVLEMYSEGELATRIGFSHGLKDGDLVVYAVGAPGPPGAKVVSHQLYRQGKLHGPSYWYNPLSGRLTKQAQFLDDKPHGDTVEYYADGSVRERTPHIGGVPHGVVETFHPNGRLAERKVFDAGKQVGPPEKFDINGRRLAAEDGAF